MARTLLLALAMAALSAGPAAAANEAGDIPCNQQLARLTAYARANAGQLSDVARQELSSKLAVLGTECTATPDIASHDMRQLRAALDRELGSQSATTPTTGVWGLGG